VSASLQLYILCYNRADLARQAIQSALAQTDKRFELVVSDNSTDGRTKAMMEAEFPQVSCRTRSPHLKALDHFNLCLGEASASHVCLFHDDDVLSSRYVERVLAAMRAHPGAAAIAVNAWVAEEGRPHRLSFEAVGKDHRVHDARQLASHYFGRHQLGIAPFPGYVYATSQLAGLRFDTEGGKYSDVSWLLRVIERGPFVWLAEPLMTYRLHASNDSRSESLGDRLRLLGYFKRHVPSVGSLSVADLRFFIYKKALERSARHGHVLPPKRRRVIQAYLSGYRWSRLMRIDQHLALLRRLRVRLERHWVGLAQPRHGATG
jgi:glycosyltransferase involved in cell wall biosynthesis